MVPFRGDLSRSEEPSKIKPPSIWFYVYIGGPVCLSFIPVIINAIKEIKEKKQNQVRPILTNQIREMWNDLEYSWMKALEISYKLQSYKIFWHLLLCSNHTLHDNNLHNSQMYFWEYMKYTYIPEPKPIISAYHWNSTSHKIHIRV